MWILKAFHKIYMFLMGEMQDILSIFMVVNRIEKDIKKLTELYEEGYACAEKVLTPYLKV